MENTLYSKTCLKRPLKKKTKNCFSILIIAKCRSKVLQNAPLEHSAILWTFIKLPFVFKTFVLSIFEWPLKTGFTVHSPDVFLCLKPETYFYSLFSKLFCILQPIGISQICDLPCKFRPHKGWHSLAARQRRG